MSRERWVRSVRGVAQRRSVDVRVESRWQSTVGRLLYRARNHQLQQAVERTFRDTRVT